MRALVLEEFGRMAVHEQPDTVVGDGEVLIRIVATGICGSDLHGYTGENGRRKPGQIMGHESAGYVAALGPGVDASGLKVGDPVTFNPVVIPDEHVEPFRGREQMSPRKRVVGVDPAWVSSFAQLVAIPARNVVSLPAELPIEHGALVEPLAVAVHAVRRAGVRPGDRVLVTGGGPIGQSAVLALRVADAGVVVVSEVDARRRALTERLGAIAIDATSGDAIARAQQAAGGPFDVAIDAVGIDPTLAMAFGATRIGATVCLVGMGAPRVAIDAYRISTDERTLIGSFTYASGDFRDAAEWIATSDVVGELISEQVPLDAGDAAFARLAAGDTPAGKVIVRLDR